jgi:hypothetical protein
MGGLMGGDNGAQREAKRQAMEARRNQQTASEEEGRTRQRAERTGVTSSRAGRDLLVGNLSSTGLKTKIGQ